MDGVERDLTIAIAGAVIGPVLIYLCQAGFQWTTRSRSVKQQQRASDFADWRSGDAAKRQRVFNVYLFSVLKFFIIGSILIGVANGLSDLQPGSHASMETIDYVMLAMDAVGVLFYVATLAEILQFTKLVRQHS